MSAFQTLARAFVDDSARHHPGRWRSKSRSAGWSIGRHRCVGRCVGWCRCGCRRIGRRVSRCIGGSECWRLCGPGPVSRLGWRRRCGRRGYWRRRRLPRGCDNGYPGRGCIGRRGRLGGHIGWCIGWHGCFRRDSRVGRRRRWSPDGGQGRAGYWGWRLSGCVGRRRWQCRRAGCSGHNGLWRGEVRPGEQPPEDQGHSGDESDGQVHKVCPG